MPLLNIVCYQVEVSASGWSLFQMIRTEFGVSECDRESSIMKGPRPTRGCYPMGKMPNTTYFINQCPSPFTWKKTNFRKLDLFRSSHEKYVISLCLIGRVLLPMLGILTVRQSQDTQSELFQGYWNWILLISFSFNGAKITKLLHAHFKLYGLILNFIFHFDW